MTTTSFLSRDWRGHPLRKLMWAGAAGLLLLPAVAMRFTAEVDWSPFDFAFAAALLAAAGAAVEVGMRLSRDAFHRAGVAVAVGGAFVTLWANAAVGLIGSEADDVNLLYLGVVATALVGSIAARLRARGMARAMAAALVLHVAIGVAALALGRGPALQVAGVTLVFGMPWLLAAVLFGIASRTEGRSVA